MSKIKRKVIKIDEEKCTGCGLCVPDCPEGALQIIDGKARLISKRPFLRRSRGLYRKLSGRRDYD